MRLLKSFRIAVPMILAVFVVAIATLFPSHQPAQAGPVWQEVASRSTTQEPVRNATLAGEGVYLHNGEFRFDLNLISIPGRHLPLSVALTYRSQLNYDGPLGYGWSANFLSRMTYDDVADEITWYTGSGRIDTFTLQSGGTAGVGPYEMTGYHLHLERQDNASPGDDSDDSILVYDSGNFAESAIYNATNTDSNSDRVFRCEFYNSRTSAQPIEIVHNGSGEVTEILGDMYDPGTSTTRYKLSFTYDATTRRLTKISDYADYSAQSSIVGNSYTGNREWEFVYDGNGDLDYILLPKTERYYSSTKGANYRTRVEFGYDGNHNMTEVIDARQANESSPIAWLYNDYDGSDRIEYQDVGRTTSGDTTKRHHFVYNSSTDVDCINALNYRSNYTMNADGTTSRVRHYTGEWNTSLTQTANAIRAGDPSYFETSYEYDSELHISKITYPEGNSTEYLYDTGDSDVRVRGNLLRILQRPDAGRSSSLPTEQEHGLLTVMTYLAADNANLLKTVTGPRAYNVPSGFQIGDAITGSGDFTTTYTYDLELIGEPTNAGLLRTVVTPEVEEATVAPDSLDDGQSITTTYQYTMNNQLEHVSDGLGVRTTYVYGTSGFNQGYLTEIQVGSQASNLAGSLDTTFTYNSVGRQITMTDPKFETYTTYVNQLDQEIRGETPQVSDHGNVTYYSISEYDLNGNLEKSKLSNFDETGTAGTPATIDTTYAHNIMDFVSSVTEPITSSTDRTTSYSYDNLYRLTETTLPEGNKSATDYDEVNRAIESAWGYDTTNVTKANALETSETHYDKNSNMTKVVDGRGNDSHATFDGYDRLIESEDRLATNANRSIYEYNRASQVTSVLRKGKTRRYVSNAYTWTNDWVMAETQTMYDNIGRPYLVRKRAEDSENNALEYSTHETSTNFQTGWMSVRTKYLDNGLPQFTRDDLGYENTIEYDAYNRVSKKIDDRDSAGTDNNSDEYEYDDNSNLVKLTAKFYDEANSAFRTIITEYSHDSINRLIEEKSPDLGGSTFLYKYWRYDSRSNLVKMTDRKGLVHRYEYDLLDRQTKGFDDDLVMHQINGSNLGSTSTEDVGGVTVYDKNSNVIKVHDSNGNTTEMRYDLAHRWLQTRHADGGGTPHATTAGGDASVSQVGTTVFYSDGTAYDGNGNMLKLTDENGTVITRTYDVNDNMLTESANVSGAATNGITVVGDTRRSFEYDGLYRVGFASTGPLFGATTRINQTYNTLGFVERDQQGADWGGSIGWFLPEIIKSYDESGRVYEREKPEAETLVEYLFDRKHRPTEARVKDYVGGAYSYRSGLTNGVMSEYQYFGGGFTHARQTRYHPFDESRDFVSTFERDDLLRVTKIRHSRNDLSADYKLLGAVAYEYDEASAMKYEARWYDDDSGASADSPDEVDFYFHDKSNHLYKAIYNAEDIDLSSLNWTHIEENNLAHTDRVYYSRRRVPTRDKANWYRGSEGIFGTTVGSLPDTTTAATQTTTYETTDDPTKDEDTPATVGNGSRHNYTEIGQVPHGYDRNRNQTQDPLRLFRYDYLNRLGEVERRSDGADISSYRYDAFGRRTLTTKHQEIGRRVYFDSRFELDVNTDGDLDATEMVYVDGGITTDRVPIQPRFMEEATWSHRCLTAEVYHDFYIVVPEVNEANEEAFFSLLWGTEPGFTKSGSYETFPIARITLDGSKALWIYSDRWRIANANDYQTGVSAEVLQNTAGHHQLGIKYSSGGGSGIYLDGSYLMGGVDSSAAVRGRVRFGARGIDPAGAVDYESEEVDYTFNQSVLLLDYISYMNPMNHVTGEFGTTELMGESFTYTSMVRWMPNVDDTPKPMVDYLVDSSTADVKCAGGPLTTSFYLADGRANTWLIIQPGVLDPLNVEIPTETVGVHHVQWTDGQGKPTIYTPAVDADSGLLDYNVAPLLHFDEGYSETVGTNKRLDDMCAELFPVSQLEVGATDSEQRLEQPTGADAAEARDYWRKQAREARKRAKRAKKTAEKAKKLAGEGIAYIDSAIELAEEEARKAKEAYEKSREELEKAEELRESIKKAQKIQSVVDADSPLQAEMRGFISNALTVIMDYLRNAISHNEAAQAHATEASILVQLALERLENVHALIENAKIAEELESEARDTATEYDGHARFYSGLQATEDITTIVSAATGIGFVVKWLAKKGAKKIVKEGIDELKDVNTKIKCFVAGTLVLTKEGNRPIEELRVGDEVWSYDEATGKFGWKTVTQTHENRYDGIIVTLVIGNEEIECTSGHPFFVTAGVDLDTRATPHELGYRSAKEGRWVAAYYLRSGDQLLDGNGNKVTLSEVGLRNERTWVYNLAVEGSHTYAVSSSAIIAHNTFNCEQKALLDMAKRDKKIGKEITEADVQAYKDLAAEANKGAARKVRVRGPESHPNRPAPSSQRKHAHVKPGADHIPVK